MCQELRLTPAARQDSRKTLVAAERSEAEPVLASYYHSSVLSHASIEAALTAVLAGALGTEVRPEG